jgi:hypothetical protein
MKKKCRIKPPSNRYKNGSVLRGIGAGAYGLAEGILDTATFGLTDELTDKGFEGLQNLAKTPEEERRAQEGIKGITNTAGAAGAAIGASILAPQLAPKMFKSAISEGVEGTTKALDATNNEALGMAGQGLTTASNIAMPFINFRYGGGNPKTKEKPSKVFQSVQRSAPINPNWQNEYYHFDKDNARVWKTAKDRFNTFKQDVFPNKYSNIPEFRKITTTFKNGGVTPPHTNMYPNGGPGLTGYLGYDTRYPNSLLGRVSYGKQFKANEGYHIPSLEVYGSKYGPGIKGQYRYINPINTGRVAPIVNTELGYDPKRKGYAGLKAGMQFNLLNDKYNKLSVAPQAGYSFRTPSKGVLQQNKGELGLRDYTQLEYGLATDYEKTFDNKNKLGLYAGLFIDPVSGKMKEASQGKLIEEIEENFTDFQSGVDNYDESVRDMANADEMLKFLPRFEVGAKYSFDLAAAKRNKKIKDIIAKQNAQKTLDAQSKPQIENYTFMRDDYKYGANMYANGGYGNNNMNQIPVTQFGNGGSHEENPLGGIPQGMGANGKMNLVEEGELKIPDPRPQSEGGFFIVSADPSMKITKGIAEDYNLPKKLVGKSVLKAAESILRKGTGREGDSIEENSINIDLSNFLDAHEELTAMAEAKEEGKFMEELAKLEEKYPEYMQALMGAPEPPMEEMPMDPSMQGQQGPSPEEQAMMEQEMMAQQQGGMPPGAMPMGAPGMDPAMMGGMPPEAMGMPMMYGGEMYAQGGKMPKEVLKARAESHMSKEAADAYVNNYGYGSKMYENGGPGDPPKKSYKQPVVSDNTRVVTSAPYYPSQKELQSAIKNKEEFDALKKRVMDDPAGHIAWPGNPRELPMATDSARLYYAQPGRGYTLDYFGSPTLYGTMNSGGFPNVNEAVEAIQKGKATYNPGKYYDEDSTYYNVVTKEPMIKNRGYKYGSTMGNMYGMGTNMYLLGDTMTVDNLDLNSQTSLPGGVGNDIIGLSEEEKKFDDIEQLSYQKSLGTLAGQAAPIVGNLISGLLPPKEYDGSLGRMSPVELERMEAGQTPIDIKQTSERTRGALRNAGVGAGNYLANLNTFLNSRNSALAQFETDRARQNAIIANQEAQLNTGIAEKNMGNLAKEFQFNEGAETAKAAALRKVAEQVAQKVTAGEQDKLGLMYANAYADNPNFRLNYQPNPFAGMFNKDQEG